MEEETKGREQQEGVGLGGGIVRMEKRGENQRLVKRGVKTDTLSQNDY